MSFGSRPPAAPVGLADWRWSPWLWLGLALTTVVLRAPLLLLEPRLFAEEASVYLAYSRQSSFLATLLLVPTSEGPAGYMVLATNTIMALAKGLPLEWVPHLTSLAALVVQILPVIAVLWSHSTCWSSPQARAGAVLVLSLSPALDPEVWLTTLHTPIFLAVTAALILVADAPRTRRGRWLARTTLAVGAASGAYTALLAPAFLLRAWRSRDREHAVQFLWVVIPATLQVASYHLTRIGLETAPLRPTPAWELLTLSIALDHLSAGVLGPTLTGWLASTSGLAPGFERALGVVPELAAPGIKTAHHLRLSGLAALGLIVWFFVVAAREPRLRVLLVALACCSVFPALLAFGAPRGRYAVVAGLLTGLVVYAMAHAATTGRGRTLARAGALLLVGSGAAGFTTDPPRCIPHAGCTQLLRPPAANRPFWREEVTRWRIDPSQPLRVWPYTENRAWLVFLPSEDSDSIAPRDSPRSHLISIGQPVSRTLLELDPRNTSFKVVLGLHAQTEGVIHLELRVLDETGVVAAATRLAPMHHLERRTVVVHPRDLIWIDEPRPVVRLEARATASPAGRVTFLDVSVEPVVVGLLDKLRRPTDRR